MAVPLVRPAPLADRAAPDVIVMRDALDGSVLTSLDLRHMAQRYGSPCMVIHRGDLHGIFLRACQRAGVDLRTRARVTGYANTLDGARVTRRRLRAGGGPGRRRRRPAPGGPPIMAIEDGYVLAGHLAAHPGGTDAALAAYQAVRPAHCRRVLLASRAWGDLWHLDGPERERRNEILRARDPHDCSFADWLYSTTALTPGREPEIFQTIPLDSPAPAVP